MWLREPSDDLDAPFMPRCSTGAISCVDPGDQRGVPVLIGIGIFDLDAGWSIQPSQ